MRTWEFSPLENLRLYSAISTIKFKLNLCAFFLNFLLFFWFLINKNVDI
jgi:hypothetical protein